MKSSGDIQIVDVAWINDDRVGIRAMVGDTVCWQLHNYPRPATRERERELVDRMKANPSEWLVDWTETE